jgi:alpha-D-xyloside xylohydrolase
MALCLFGFFLICLSSAQVTRLANGVRVKTAHGYVRLQVVSDSILRVVAGPTATESESSMVVPGPLPSNPQFKMVSAPGAISIETGKLNGSVDKVTGQVSFIDSRGRTLLAEKRRELEPALVQGQQTNHVHQEWKGDPNEALFGLGQQQLGIIDIKGYDLDLWQHNTNIVVPFLVSSKGYGVLWNNLSYARFGDLRSFSAIPAEDLLGDSGKSGGLTLHSSGGGSQSADLALNRGPRRAEYSGYLLAPTSGDYQFNCYSNGAIKVWINGEKMMDHWRQSWLTSDDRAKLHLEKGHRYELHIQWGGEQASTMVFTWKPPLQDTLPDTSLWSEVGNAVDYFFVYGPSLDQVVAGNRTLTGKATMPPRWAFGLWQSRQRYETADQSLNVIKEFRKRHIPFDNIVQDWFYWKQDQWGSHEFDPARFPDPTKWLKGIHDLHSNLMISVWGKFYPNTENARAMQAKGFLYQPNLEDHLRDWIGFPYTFYDAFNPAARKLYWDQINKNLFSKGIDAWWLDATEPDLTPSPPRLEWQEKYMNPTALGPASRVLNGYALYTSKGIFEGQRTAAPNKRVFILTRSGFAGQQRYGAASWSGDVTSTWTALKKQIAAGLGFSISGVPYWATDTGGYTMERKFAVGATGRNTPEEEDEWRELNARWFEFSTFSPILRVHGELRPRELWTLGDSPDYKAELKFDRLRYQLFPYIYSLASDVTQHGGSFLRPMVMDYPDDASVRDATDQYMFGHEFLVAPVTSYKARFRQVTLPTNSRWYDFWSGHVVESGSHFFPAPLEAPPIFVRAGSIIPMQPVQQWIGEKPIPVITVLVYAGAEGHFTLYQDDGLTNAYERGAFAEIPLTWDDHQKALVCGKRKGSFPGMREYPHFKVIVVKPGHPWSYATQ